MHIDIDKLKAHLEELYDDVGGWCLTSEVCIYEGEDSNGKPMQILLKATIDDDEMNDQSGEHICIRKHPPESAA